MTGPTAIDADIDAVFEGIDTTLMLVTVIVVAFLLIITYRSPFLWLVPLLTVGAAAYLSMALVRIVAGALDLTVSTQSSSIMIVMVFGAGTDYALLIVARYREQLRHHRDVHAAMRAALKSVGPAILASGSTVALGLGCLVVADMNDISGIGVIGALGILATLVTMLTLFPAVLTALGRKVFWPRVPALGSTAPAGRDWWRWVFARPLRSAGVSALALGLLGLGVLGLSTDLRQADSFTSTPESVTGFATLDRAYPGEGGRPFTVATPTDQVEQVLAVARATDKVVSAETEREGDGWSLVDVVPAAQPDSDEEAAVIKRLRADLPPAALVGGEGAERVDVQEASAADTKLVIPLVLAVVLLVLFLLLRSLVASLLVVAAVVLSWLAALGLGSLVFEHVLGFGGVEPTLPVLVFVFLVAFGVDYAIFLVARIAEDRKELGTAVATRRAVRATAPVIASAGLVLAATFAVLASLPFVPMVEMGVVVAVGVLLQTLRGSARVAGADDGGSAPMDLVAEPPCGEPATGSGPGRVRAGRRGTELRMGTVALVGARRLGIGRIDLLLTAALLVLPVAAVLALPRHWLDDKQLDALGFALLVLATLPVLVRRRYPIQGLLFCRSRPDGLPRLELHARRHAPGGGGPHLHGLPDHLPRLNAGDGRHQRRRSPGERERPPGRIDRRGGDQPAWLVRGRRGRRPGDASAPRAARRRRASAGSPRSGCGSRATCTTSWRTTSS